MFIILEFYYVFFVYSGVLSGCFFNGGCLVFDSEILVVFCFFSWFYRDAYGLSV